MTNKIQNIIPEPTVRRLIQIAALISQERKNGVPVISSSQIGKTLGVEAHTIRKDINYLGGTGNTPGGYPIDQLLERINHQLGLLTSIKTCVVGLGRLGESLVNYTTFKEYNIDVVAAFDVNINKLETLKSDVPLFPAYEMEDVIHSKQIKIAILAVPADEANGIFEKLSRCQIKGILNYTGAILPGKTQAGIFVRNININHEINLLKVLVNQK